MNNATLTAPINRHALDSLEPDFLQMGDRGEAVKNLQQALSDFDLYRGALDGEFGGRTSNAVSLLQRRLGLEATGSFDHSTWYGLSFWTDEAATPVSQRRSTGNWTPFQRAAKFFGFGV
ncbi:MAG: peptidoglycan-binding protein [Limnothrix sp. RL_2_0]|nr:peptidoglycan-binding protein [Limnothrix sp. RL_2_0]